MNARRFAVGLLAVLDLAIGHECLGAAPVLQQIYPAVLRVGTTNEVELVGTFDPWPVSVWTSAGGLVVEPLTNKGRVRITVAEDAPQGPALLRCHNADGASDPAIFKLTSSAVAPEVEPNDDFRKPQRIETTTVGINGRLDKSGDVDSYAVDLVEGQTLVASLNAYLIASPFDGVLRLVDSEGTQVAWNHDFADTLDPRLVWTAPKAGTYVLQVFGFAYPAGSEIQLTGSARCVYFLEITTGEFIAHTLPLAALAGATNHLRLVGWNLSSNQTARLDLAVPGQCEAEPRIPRPLSHGHPNFSVPVSQGPVILEAEPNDKADPSNPLTIPFDITGTFGLPLDQDRFPFTATKGGLHLFQVHSAQLGFPTDPWLAIEDASGKELVRNDDSPANDPQIVWQVPADGVYFVVTGNLLRRGGEELVYRLTATHERPRIEAKAASSSLVLEAGKTNTFNIATRRRHGHNAETKLVVSALPAGVVCLSTNAPEKDGDWALQFSVPADAPAHSGEFALGLLEPDQTEPTPIFHELVTSAINNGVPSGFQHLWIDKTDRFWLTIKPSAPPPSAVPASN